MGHSLLCGPHWPVTQLVALWLLFFFFFFFWSQLRTRWDGCKDGSLLPQFICTMNISQLRSPYKKGGDSFCHSVEEQWRINFERQ